MLKRSMVVPAFVAGFLIAGSSVEAAQPKQVESTATGYGASEQEALGDALARAASQINGGSASMSTRVDRVEGQATVQSNDGTKRDATYKAKASSSPDFTASGQIARYEVLSTSKKGPEEYAVQVKAWVNKYEAPSKTGNQDRVAVLPVRTTTGVLDFYRDSITAVALADLIGRSLERTLIETGHFQVLDRVSLGDSVMELTLLSSDLTGPDEKAKLKNVRGADYLVLSTLDVTQEGKRNPATGQKKAAAIELDVRIVVPATSEVAHSVRVPVKTSGYANKEAAIAAATAEVVGAFDAKTNGSTSVARTPPAEAPPETPRNDAGVKLPYD